MDDRAFSEPVILWSPGRGERRVANSFEAMECLTGEWPERSRGRSWRSACNACRDALDGWRSPHEARRKFLYAARRAGLVPGRRQRSVPRHQRDRAQRVTVRSR